MSIWPEGAQSAAVVTVNFDGESFEQPLLPDEPLWGRYAYGRYGAQEGVYRLLEVFRRHEVRATFFLPGWDVERYPDVMETIARDGHETAARGYANENFALLSPEQQQEILQRTEASFDRVFGKTPSGFRGPSALAGVNDPGQRLAIPGSLMSSATRAVLCERGYRYDSSYCDDDLPYIVTPGDGLQLVEIPHHPSQSDRVYYEHHRMPEVVSEAWREELSATHEAGALFNLAVSPRGDWGSGRGVRLRAVEDILQALRETPKIWVATCDEVADWMLGRDLANQGNKDHL